MTLAKPEAEKVREFVRQVREHHHVYERRRLAAAQLGIACRCPSCCVILDAQPQPEGR